MIRLIFNEIEYIKNLEEVKKRYHRKIVSKGIISLIYQGAKWSEVESYKENDDCNECLLIDIGTNYKSLFFIPHVKMGVNIYIHSDNIVSNTCTGISHEYANFHILNNKPVIERDSKACYLDFFHLDNEYYVPSRFCYCTNMTLTQTDIYTKEELTKEFQEIIDIGKEYTDPSLQRETMERKNAIDYLKKKYCSDKKKQYVKTLSVISEIISSLLRINYSKFYSEKYKFANTVFNIGFEQLTYFMEDNNINYSKEEVSIIYKYLITEWIKLIPGYLKSFNFEEMFNYYNKNEDIDYAINIDKYRDNISKFKSLDVLDDAYNSYTIFLNKNEDLIKTFISKFIIENEIPRSSLDDIFDSIGGDRFIQLKESIKDYQKILDWNVPYYLRIIVVDGKTEHRFADKLQGYGHVGDKKTVNLIQDEKYSVEGSDSITLGLNENIVEIKYILKAEYVQEQSDEIDLNNTEVVLKKAHNYIIAFEALGISTAPFSVIIIRRAKNNSFEPVFEKNDIELSPDFKSYSYEFTYNGESEERCYLAFGYGNIIGGYNIRHLHVSEIE